MLQSAYNFVALPGRCSAQCAATAIIPPLSAAFIISCPTTIVCAAHIAHRCSCLTALALRAAVCCGGQRVSVSPLPCPSSLPLSFVLLPPLLLPSLPPSPLRCIQPQRSFLFSPPSSCCRIHGPLRWCVIDGVPRHFMPSHVIFLLLPW